MGLDISHDTWHGAYSAFNLWRQQVAYLAGFPPLELMEGFYDEDHQPFILLHHLFKSDDISIYPIKRLMERLPIKWDAFSNDPLSELLYHSDCDGYITYGKCGKIAKRLTELLPIIDDSLDFGGHIGNFKSKTLQFIKGLELANSRKEKLIFR